MRPAAFERGGTGLLKAAGLVHDFSGLDCRQCAEGERETTIACFISALFILFAALRWVQKRHKRLGKVMVEMLAERNMPFKLLVGFIQVATTIPENFRLVYPAPVMHLGVDLSSPVLCSVDCIRVAKCRNRAPPADLRPAEREKSV